MPETTALGAAMAAGAAEGVSVWSLQPEDLSEVTSEKFEPQINTEGEAPAMTSSQTVAQMRVIAARSVCTRKWVFYDFCRTHTKYCPTSICGHVAAVFVCAAWW